MPKQPAEGQAIKNQELVMKLINQIPDDPDMRRMCVLEMLDGPVGYSYFTAPASGREDFHSAYPGGLVQHSLNVVQNLNKLAKTLCPGVYKDDTLIFVGLFHDLGKAGDGKEEAYVPNPNDNGRRRGYLYETNKKCVYMPSSERSIYLLQMYGIVLTSDEYLAIRLNDGQYPDDNRSYRMKEPDLALLTHWADMWAVRQEKV